MKDEYDPGTQELAVYDPIAEVATHLAPLRERSVQSQYLDAEGRELPNPTPVAPPVGYKRQPTIAEQMRQMIRQASYEASQMGAETEAEANDFDVGEDMEPDSPYENDFEPDPALEHMIALRSRPPAAPAAVPQRGDGQGEAKPPLPVPPPSTASTS